MNVWICHKLSDGLWPRASFTVFKNLLGETILIDDLDSGNSYRKAVSDTRCSKLRTAYEHITFLLSVRLLTGGAEQHTVSHHPDPAGGQDQFQGEVWRGEQQSPTNSEIHVWSPVPTAVPHSSGANRWPLYSLDLKLTVVALVGQIVLNVFHNVWQGFSASTAQFWRRRTRQKRSTTITQKSWILQKCRKNNKIWRRRWNSWRRLRGSVVRPQNTFQPFLFLFRNCYYLIVIGLFSSLRVDPSETTETSFWQRWRAVGHHCKENKADTQIRDQRVQLFLSFCFISGLIMCFYCFYSYRFVFFLYL